MVFILPETVVVSDNHERLKLRESDGIHSRRARGGFGGCGAAPPESK